LNKDQGLSQVNPPDDLINLVRKYEEHRDSYIRHPYKEARLQREFIEPLLELLNWDVQNKQGYAEAYKEVISEDAIRISGTAKAPDYCCQIGGVRKFFVEVKKPSVDISTDNEAALQLRRYGWNTKLPLSILTNFEEFSVYDTRIPPRPSDMPSTARVANFPYTQLGTQWGFLASVFSKDAILKGNFDRYAESSKRKKGTAEVDDLFLSEIEVWRDKLARNIALRNEVSAKELNFAVQAIIDRIVFLRICEDRGLETYGKLRALLNGPDSYDHLKEFFRLADEKYNSGVFHFKAEKGRASSPDALTPRLKIDDKVLNEIVSGLYYPECPYEFSILPAEILGQVYEQFLGRVIRLLPSGKATVEEKPEVKKSGGVYYTPTPVVSHIIKSTLRTMLKDKKPEEISRLRILDPACGSGTFLIKAYQELLDWHLQYYLSDGTRKHKKEIVQGLGQTWFLTTSERKRILLNNIFGCDIDPQAVEVTRLSLLLKVLEQTPGDAVERNQKLFHERALPDIDGNIKCGNSLIGPSFFHAQQGIGLSEDDRMRINVFDWKREFPGILASGGFDAVVGNPPWGATFSQEELEYFRNSYKAAQGSTVDSYAIFIERALNLLRPGGLLGYITPDTFLRKDDHLSTRKLLLQNTIVKELVETGPVFSKVRDTWCLVFTAVNSADNEANRIAHHKVSRFVVSSEERLSRFERSIWTTDDVVPQAIWIGRPGLIVGYLSSEADQRLIAKLERNPRLGALKEKYRISRGEEGSKFALQQDRRGDFFMITPADVERHYVKQGMNVTKKSLTDSKVVSFYSHPKIWIIRIQKMRWKRRLICSFDERRNSSGMKTLQTVVSNTDSMTDLKYLVGLLNSSLINYWCVNYLADDMNQTYLEKIPINLPEIGASETADYDHIVQSVDMIKDLASRLGEARTDHERNSISRQISAIDDRIDEIVYKLYGLTSEDVALVEKEESQGPTV